MPRRKVQCLHFTSRKCPSAYSIPVRSLAVKCSAKATSLPKIRSGMTTTPSVLRQPVDETLLIRHDPLWCDLGLLVRCGHRRTLWVEVGVGGQLPVAFHSRSP